MKKWICMLLRFAPAFRICSYIQQPNVAYLNKYVQELLTLYAYTSAKKVVHQILYQLFLVICSSLNLASSAIAFIFSAFSSFAILSLYNLRPCIANAIPRCSSLRRLSHHAYMPTAPTNHPPTAILHDRKSFGMPVFKSTTVALVDSYQSHLLE